MGETALTAEELALVASLEEHLAAVARGAASRFVLILSDAGERVVAEVERRGALVVRVPPGEGSLGERTRAALVARLVERRDGRPGVAALVDPLISRAAEYVLGTDLPSLESYLTPEALDEVPAVAGRALVQRFVPALATVLAGVPESIIETLLRERSGWLEGRPGLAEVVRRSDTPLEVLLGIAVRAERGLLVWHGCVEQGAAARAHEVAVSATGHGAVTALTVSRATWDLERVLLDETERDRLERFSTTGTGLGAALETMPPVTPAARVPVAESRTALLTSPSLPHPSVTPDRLGPQPVTLERERALPLAVSAPIRAVATPVEASSALQNPTLAADALTPRPKHARQRSRGWPSRPTAAALIVVPAGIAAIWAIARRNSSVLDDHGNPIAIVEVAKDIADTADTAEASSVTESNTTASVQSRSPATPRIKRPEGDAVATSSTAAQASPLQASFDSGSTLAAKLRVIDKAIAAGRRPEVVILIERVLDRPEGKEPFAHELKLALLTRLGPFVDDERVLNRLLGDLDPSAAQDERRVAISALARYRESLDERTKSRIAVLASSDRDDFVQQQARTIVEDRPSEEPH